MRSLRDHSRPCEHLNAGKPVFDPPEPQTDWPGHAFQLHGLWLCTNPYCPGGEKVEVQLDLEDRLFNTLRRTLRTMLGNVKEDVLDRVAAQQVEMVLAAILGDNDE